MRLITADFNDLNQRVVANLLAMLRALAWNYQTSHWQAVGENFYGDHLLFERLYGNVQKEIDSIAEKAIGLFGNDTVAATDSASRTFKMLAAVSPITEDVARGVALEGVLLDGIKRLDLDEMTPGLRNFIEGLADAHEGHIYLLGQRGNGPTSDVVLYDTKVASKTAAGAFDRESAMWAVLVKDWAEHRPEKTDVNVLVSIAKGAPTLASFETFTRAVQNVRDKKADSWLKRMKSFVRAMLFGAYTKEFKTTELMISAFFKRFMVSITPALSAKTASLEDIWFGDKGVDR